MDKTEQTLRLKIAHIDLTEWYEGKKSWMAKINEPPYITNVDLFMEAFNRCKDLDEIQTIVDDIKPHKELYNGIHSLLYPRPVHPESVDEAIEQIEFDIKEAKAGKVYWY